MLDVVVMLTFALHLHRWRGCRFRRRTETVAVTCGVASFVLSRNPVLARASGLDVPAQLAPGVLIEMSAWRADDERSRFIPRTRL